MMSPHVGGGSLAEALPPGLPTVLMNTRVSRGTRAAYLVDDFGGARALTCHLASCGYRRITHIRGPRDNFEAEERLRGYRAGLGARRAMVIDGDFSEESGYRAGQALAAGQTRPDAVFAANDAMAIGCLRTWATGHFAISRCRRGWDTWATPPAPCSSTLTATACWICS